jgi:hypothetical protein
VTDLVVIAEDAAPVKVSSGQIKLGIRSSFSNGYQTFFEVGNDTGTRVTRHADAVAIGIWPSTGHQVHGFEVKVSRGDWLRELKDPSKADGWFEACHGWWLATPPDIVKRADLPTGWGHVVVKPDGEIRVSISPEPREVAPLSWSRLAGLLRVVDKRVRGTVPRRQLEKLAAEQSEAQIREATTSARAQAARMVREERRQLRVVQEAARAFEVASGISLNLACGPEAARRLGASLRADRAQDNALRRLRDAVGALRSARDYAETALRELEHTGDEG